MKMQSFCVSAFILILFSYLNAGEHRVVPISDDGWGPAAEGFDAGIDALISSLGDNPVQDSAALRKSLAGPLRVLASGYNRDCNDAELQRYYKRLLQRLLQRARSNANGGVPIERELEAISQLIRVLSPGNRNQVVTLAVRIYSLFVRKFRGDHRKELKDKIRSVLERLQRGGYDLDPLLTSELGVSRLSEAELLGYYQALLSFEWAGQRCLGNFIYDGDAPADQNRLDRPPAGARGDFAARWRAGLTHDDIGGLRRRRPHSARPGARVRTHPDLERSLDSASQLFHPRHDAGRILLRSIADPDMPRGRSPGRSIIGRRGVVYRNREEYERDQKHRDEVEQEHKDGDVAASDSSGSIPPPPSSTPPPSPPRAWEAPGGRDYSSERARRVIAEAHRVRRMLEQDREARRPAPRGPVPELRRREDIDNHYDQMIVRINRLRALHDRRSGQAVPDDRTALPMRLLIAEIRAGLQEVEVAAGLIDA